MKGVLVVDGAAFFRSYLRRLIEQWGWEVAGVCASGGEAVAECQRLNPGAVILDVFLPDASGWDVVAALRRTCPEAALIVCTAAGDRASLAVAVRLGVRDYLLKPVDEERLRAALAACLGEPGRGRGAGSR